MKPSTNIPNNPSRFPTHKQLTFDQQKLFLAKSQLQYNHMIYEDLFRFIMSNISDIDLLNEIYEIYERYICIIDSTIANHLSHENND